MGKVIVASHGKCFGYGNWYTFHCPTCNAQVNGRQEQCKCGQKLEWAKSIKEKGDEWTMGNRG